MSCSYIRGSGQLSVSLLTLNVRWSYSAAPTTLRLPQSRNTLILRLSDKKDYKKPSCLEKGQDGNRCGFPHRYLQSSGSEVPVVSVRRYFALHPLKLGLKSLVTNVNVVCFCLHEMRSPNVTSVLPNNKLVLLATAVICFHTLK